MERVGTASIHSNGMACQGNAAERMEMIPSHYSKAQKNMVVDGKPQMICRISNFEIPKVCAKGNFVVCTLVDRYDSKDLTIDQRLMHVAGVLDPVLTCFDTPPSPPSVVTTKSHHRAVLWHRRHNTTCAMCNGVRTCAGSMPSASHDHADAGAALASGLLHRLLLPCSHARRRAWRLVEIHHPRRESSPPPSRVFLEL
jgi:hypothetical protein